MINYKGRFLSLEQVVHVYRNLNKPGVWFSVRDAKTRLVLGHTQSIMLKDAEFVVQPAGRDKVRREKKKNVHAFVKGTVVPNTEWIRFANKAMYDPYRFDTFVDGMTWEPIYSAPLVYISSGIGVLYERFDKDENLRYSI